MVLYLLHQGRDGTVKGVWRDQNESYYPAGSDAKENYGKAVIANMGSEVEWDDFAEQLASKFPGPKDQWDLYEADGTLELSEVFEEAQGNTSYSE